MDKEGGASLNGSAYVQSLSHSAPIDGKVEVDISFQGTGALTYSTTT
jgi:predicted secreted protein